eukprot:2259132-Amphidinium_carterae.1
MAVARFMLQVDLMLHVRLIMHDPLILSYSGMTVTRLMLHVGLCHVMAVGAANVYDLGLRDKNS